MCSKELLLPSFKADAFVFVDNDSPTPSARVSRNESARSTSSSDNDAMLLDDTKYTTYIHNLDQELAELDSSGENLVISPLAAKMISVPQSILSRSAQGKELVLYTDPSSLSIPKEQDSVRQAILDSRARARAKAKTKATAEAEGSSVSADVSANLDTTVFNADPMDIDVD